MNAKYSPQEYDHRKVRAKDKAHFLHPWTHFESFKREGALPITRGQGCEIFDADGKRYLDAVGGLWCNNIGLGRDEMAQSIADQARLMSYANSFCDMTNPPAAELACRLADLAPGPLKHVIYSSGGSTAVDSAYRLVQFYQNCRGKPEKRHVISRIGSYHGSTYLSMSIGGKRGDRVPEFEFKSDTIHHISPPNFYRAATGLNESEFCDQLILEFEQKINEIGAENVAAFFAEPVMGAGGVIVPPPTYNERTAAICRKNDILYIADEVVTGFGRLGHWFASDGIFHTHPDIITCAKGLTSGYLPLGATIFSEEIYHTISETDPDRIFAHGFTYSGHPVCCAAGLKNIEIIEREGLLEQVRENGPYFEERLRELGQLPTVGDVRGIHFMMCIENVADKTSRRRFGDDVNIGKRIANACEKLGLIVRPIGHLNILSPPLILSREQIDTCVDILQTALQEVAEDLSREGLL